MNDFNLNTIISKFIFNNLLNMNSYLNGINSSVTTDSNIFSTLYPKRPNSVSSDSTSPIPKNKISIKDSLSSPELINLFTNIENTDALDKEEINFLGKKRCKQRRPRKENKDNMRSKIKRGFFNNALIKKLNEKLRSIGSKQYLEKFSQYFVSDASRI